MTSSVQVAIFLGIAAVGASAHWLVQGRPVSAALAAEETPLQPGEVRLEDVPDGVLWVDARPEAARADGELPDAIRLDPASAESLDRQVERHLEALFGAVEIVIFCDDARCNLSHELAKRLREDYGGLLGGEVRVLRGGAAALRRAGRLEAPRAPVPGQ